jgi:hypothetical protein
MKYSIVQCVPSYPTHLRSRHSQFRLFQSEHYDVLPQDFGDGVEPVRYA